MTASTDEDQERHVHPTAIISPNARLGVNVSVGAYSIIHDNVEIGDGTAIDSHCEIGVPTPRANGRPLVIEKGAHIRSHSVFYCGSSFGEGLTTGHRVTVRELTVAGPGLQIGTLSDVQGNCVIGKCVRFHSNVHIGQHSRIGNYVWIFPYVVLTNDPHPPSELAFGVTIEDFAVVATMSVILPGILVGKGAVIGAGSCVTRDAGAHRIVIGNPARDVGPSSKIQLKNKSAAAYPWPTHFRRGYPDSAMDDFEVFLSEIPTHDE